MSTTIPPVPYTPITIPGTDLGVYVVPGDYQSTTIEIAGLPYGRSHVYFDQHGGFTLYLAPYDSIMDSLNKGKLPLPSSN